MLTKKIKTFKQLSTKVSLENNESNLVFFSKLLINVEYFIFFGTLLGITRENRLIDGDDDIDFYVNFKDRDQLIQNLKQNNVDVDLYSVIDGLVLRDSNVSCSFWNFSF